VLLQIKSDCEKTIHNPKFIRDDKNKHFSFYQASFWTSIMIEYIQANNRNQLEFYCLEEVIEAEHPARLFVVQIYQSFIYLKK